MSSILDAIISDVLVDLELRRLSQAQIDEQIKTAPPVRTLNQVKGGPLRVIAEVKRSSPSKGALAQIPDPAALAHKYQEGGASVISVLTESRRFGGSIQDLIDVRADLSLPLLRKDFLVNEYLIKEARANGADLVLLIVAALSDSELLDLYQLAKGLGMECLIEIHDQAELERALAIDPQVIGVNSRNLKDLSIDAQQFSRLLPLIPNSIVKVAESGIFTVEDARLARESGADMILVGEALVRSSDPIAQLSAFTAIA
jgi:indole-3-glycerol phosphate synthase